MKCTNFFTQELIEEIRLRLLTQSGIKDSLFDTATTPLNGEELLPILQDGKNKLLPLSLFNPQFNIDDYPTEGSSNAVSSGGTWQAIQNIISSVINDRGLLIITEEMMNTLMSNTYDSLLNIYCDKIYSACENGMLIVYKDGICLYYYQETDETKTFTFTVTTTSDTHVIAAVYNKTEPNLLWHTFQKTSNKVHIVKSTELTNTLLSYYTKAQIDALLTTVNNRITENRSLITNHYNEYLNRMEGTPLYHKANWLTDEVDAKGRVTNETSVSTPRTRFSSLWWAIKESKLITYYGIPDIYRKSDIEGNNPANVDTFAVKFLINNLIVTYQVSKHYDANNNLYLLVDKQEQSLDSSASKTGNDIDPNSGLTILGASTRRTQIDLSGKLDEFSSFSDITIDRVPLIIDRESNYESLLCDLRIIKCDNLVLNKTDYANLCDLITNSSVLLYKNKSEDAFYNIGTLSLVMNESSEVVLKFTNILGNVQSLVLNNKTLNSNIVDFLNSIFRKCNIIGQTGALALLLEALQCKIEVTLVVKDTECFIRNNNSYQCSRITLLPEMEIAQV